MGGIALSDCDELSTGCLGRASEHPVVLVLRYFLADAGVEANVNVEGIVRK